MSSEEGNQLNSEEWKESIKKAQKEYFRFMFLDHKNFNELYEKLAEISDLIKKGKDTKYLTPHAIYSFFWQCFPDIWNDFQFNSNFNPYYIIKQAIQNLNSQINFESKDISSKIKATLDMFNTITEKALYMWDVHGLSYDERAKESETFSKPTRECISLHILEKDAPQNAVYLELVRVYNDRIHPSFILTCDNETSKDSVKTFLDRLRIFPDKDFSILHPGLLNIESRDYLLQWVSKRYSEGNTIGKLHILVRKTQGDETFSFVTKSETEKSTYDHPNISDLNNSLKLHKLTWYETGPLTGKTTHIRKQVHDFVGESNDHEKRFVTVSVTEGFQPSSFIQVVKNNFLINEANFKEVFLHLNVSPYAPLEEFGVFLYNFLAWGIIADKKTGEVFYAGTELKWYIAVEISAAPKDDDNCPYDTIEKVKETIPLVERFFVPEKVNSIVFDTESEDFLLCLNAFAITYPQTPEFPNLNMKREKKGIRMLSNLNDIKARMDIYDKKGKFSIFTEDFIKLLGKYFDEGQPQTTAALARLVKLVSDKFRKLKVFCKGQYRHPGDFFERFYNCLYFEMRQFTRVPLEAPTAYIVFRVKNEYDKQAFIVDFTDDNSLEKEARERGFDLFPIKKREEINRNPDVLYDLINDDFGITDSKSVFNKYNYVLEPESAMQLLCMHSFASTRLNAIVPCDKRSKMLEMVEILMGIESQYVPTSIDEVLKFTIGVDHHINGTEQKKKAIIEFVENKCKDLDEMDSFRYKVAEFIKRFFIVHHIEGTEFLRSIRDAEGKKDIRNALQTKDDIIDAFKDIWLIQIDTYDKFEPNIIEMNPHVTPEMFREMVRGIIYKAESTKPPQRGFHISFEPPHAIGIIKRCTSASVPGMVKEVLVDKSLDGVPLPTYITWIGTYNIDPDNRPLHDSFSLLEFK